MELQLLPYAQSISRIHNKPTQIIAFLHHEYKFIWPRLIRYQHSNTETMTSKTPSSGTETFARTIYINKTLPRFIRHSAPYLTGSCYITSGNKASSRGHGLQLHNSYHKVTRICGNSWKKKTRTYYYYSTMPLIMVLFFLLFLPPNVLPLFLDFQLTRLPGEQTQDVLRPYKPMP